MFKKLSGPKQLNILTSMVALGPTLFLLNLQTASGQEVAGPSNAACTALKQHAAIISEDILNRIGPARIASWRNHQEQELNGLVSSLNTSQLSNLRTRLDAMAQDEQRIADHLASPAAAESDLTRLRANLEASIRRAQVEVQDFTRRRNAIQERIFELQALPENPDVEALLETQRQNLQALGGPMFGATSRLEDLNLQLIRLPQSPIAPSAISSPAFNSQLARLQQNLNRSRFALGKIRNNLANLRTTNERMNSFFSPSCTTCYVDRETTYDNSSGGPTFHGYEETVVNASSHVLERCYSYHITDTQFPELQGLQLCSTKSIDDPNAPVQHRLRALQGRPEGLTSLQLMPENRGRILTDAFQNLRPLYLENLVTPRECRSDYRSGVNAAAVAEQGLRSQEVPAGAMPTVPAPQQAPGSEASTSDESR